MKTATTAILLLIVVGATTIRADEGRIPVFQPTTITQPGHYVVTRDISAPVTVINIQANGVTLDLNGHTLRSVDDPGCSGPTIEGGGAIIRNGTVSGCGNAITGASRVEDLIVDAQEDAITGTPQVIRCRVVAHDTAISAPADSVVIDNIVKGTLGISAGDRSVVRRNIVDVPSQGWVGISVSGESMIQQNKVVGECGETCTGIDINGGSNRIEGNSVTNILGDGISVDGTVNYLTENLSQENAGCAIAFENGNTHTYRNNVGGNNGSSGASCIPAGNVNLGGNHDL